MRAIRIQNPQVDSTYKTLLGADYSSGTALTVLNNASFAANDLLVIGEPSEELTELKKCSSISGSTTVNLASALNFSHSKGSPVYRVLWDFVSIESRSSSSGSFSEITQSGIQWDNDKNLTIYYDPNGTDSYEYRFRFYNSVTATYSEYSPTLAGSGFTRQQVGYMIREVRIIVNDVERSIVTDDEIIRFFNRAQDIIYSHSPKYWFLLVDTYKAGTGILATAGTNVYSLATYSTYGHLSSVRYKYTSGSNSQLYHLRKKVDVEFDKYISDLNQTNDDYALYYKLLPVDSSSSNGYLQIYPTTNSSGVGTIYPNYYEKMANLDSVDDTTQVPLPNLLEDFAISQIEKVKGNERKAQFYENSLVSQNENVTPVGLIMLDQLDSQQKEAQGQPRSLWNYRGQKAVSRLYGSSRISTDYFREFYDIQ